MISSVFTQMFKAAVIHASGFLGVIHGLLSRLVFFFFFKAHAKAAALHSALSANPRYWLGADTKATSVALCST